MVGTVAHKLDAVESKSLRSKRLQLRRFYELHHTAGDQIILEDLFDNAICASACMLRLKIGYTVSVSRRVLFFYSDEIGATSAYGPNTLAYAEASAAYGDTESTKEKKLA